MIIITSRKIMKKILIICCAIFTVGSQVLHSQNTVPSNNQNYIYHKKYLDYNANGLPSKTSETIQYLDGLGRPKQVVNVKASPLQKDVVTHIEYDAFGRQVYDYLPVPQPNTANGAIVDNPLVNATQPTIYGSEKIYSEKIFESSPLDRILEQKQVGNAWNDKPIKFKYSANITGEAIRYRTITVWENGTTKSTVINGGTYGVGKLYKKIISDEDDNKIIEFKNGQGQILLERKVLSTTENADTYYVYNEYDQLVVVIPPKAVRELEDQGFAEDEEIYSSVLNNLCYQYKYDGRNRLVEKKFPAKGWEHMVYDKLDRLVAIQDANQRLSNKWLFTKYDQFGRILYTGISIDNGDRNAVQTWINNMYGNNTETSGSYTQSDLQIHYANTAYPQNIESILAVNYYDAYLTGDPFPTLVYDQVVLPSNVQQYGVSTKGLPVSHFVKNIEDNGWTKTYLYYDLRGRQIREYSINHLGGYTNIEKRLDFSGNPHIVLTQHKRLPTDAEKVIVENFTYDHQNRLLTHKHQVDNNPSEYLAQNKYNELSQLETKKVGGVILGNGLQTVDYKYNIRGWMTQINDPANLNDGDLFGYRINYTQVEGLEIPNLDFPSFIVKPKYNGNIAETSWKTLSEDNEPLKRYGYVYDGLNRLTAGFYQRAGIETAKEYFEKIDYDLNGNITKLQRSADLMIGNNTAFKIDKLKYDYTGNRLTKITDEQENPSGYPYFINPNTIEYDNGNSNGNGNITKHLDKGISSIEYNFLNLPKQITQNAKVTNYVYRADGIKVKKFFGDIETNYLGGFQYKAMKPSEENASGGLVVIDPNEVAVMKLRIIPTSEGYFDVLNNQYIYNYTDHLGNIRLSYADTNKDGIIQPRRYFWQQCDGPWDPFNPPSCIDGWKPGEIVEVNNYYPFGLLHNYTATTQNAYQYKFNGKELQETGMYDYGARFYMPDIGRWGVMDPLASSTFNIYDYANNNPLYYIDPTGMFNVPGAPVLSPNALGGDNNPAPIQEVVINSPLRAIASRPGSIMPNNCITCYSGNGMKMDITLNTHPLPPLPKNWDCGHCNDHGVIMMDSMWDALGIVIANNMSSDNKYAMMGLGAVAIVLSKGQATDEVLKAGLAVEKAEMKVLSRSEMSNIWGAGPRIDPQNLPKSATKDLVEILSGRGVPIMRGGVQETVRNNVKWGGALEWKIKDIQGSSLNGSRILQHPNGNWGLVTDHDYTKIIQIPTSSPIK